LETILKQITYFCQIFQLCLIQLKYIVKKKNSFLILLLLVKLAAVAQQEPLFSSYMFSKAVHNPSFSGAGTQMNAVFLNRVMFLGFGEGKPITSVFGVEGPIDLFGIRSGLGLMVKSDEIGFQEQTDVEVLYAYHRNTETGKLGFGLNLGFYNYHLSPDWIYPESSFKNNDTHGYPPNTISGDRSIPNEISNMAFGIGLGAYYESTNYYVGLSATKINGAEIRNDTGTETEKGEVFFKYRPHFYLTGGYNIALPDPLFDLRPTVLLKSDLSAWQLDLNGTLFYKSRYWGGLGLRSSFVSFDAITLIMGTELVNGLNISYAIDINTSAMFLNGATSHEVMVTYSFNLNTKKDQRYKSVRYL
jgi:type IX secretion system PorP/SprF family membrane protein